MSQGQDQSEIFNGIASTGLKSAQSADGNDKRSTSAFVFGEELADIADRDPRVAVLTADLGRSNRAVDFENRHRDRYVNVGIAEKNMITAAAGIASCGYIPFAATFASFAALLCCEQIRTDCAYPRMPVRIVGHHSGMSMGFYGTSHHSLEDLGIMRTIADLTVVCATDENHLRAVLRASMDHPGAMYIRLGRGRDPEVYSAVPEITIGRSILLQEGADLTFFSTGSTVRPALDAAALLAADGYSTRVVDVFTVSPLDKDEVVSSAAATGAVLTVEEHNITNGLGTAVAETLFEAGMSGLRFKRLGIPDEHVPLGPPAALYAHYLLDAAGIATQARELMK